jgi:hypothetical protein
MDCMPSYCTDLKITWGILMILISFPEFKNVLLCNWFLCYTETVIPSSSCSHPQSLQSLHSTSSICNHCCFLYTPLEPSGKASCGTILLPHILHICFARHAIKLRHSSAAPMRCPDFTRTPYIHYSGGFSCLTLYFERS